MTEIVNPVQSRDDPGALSSITGIVAISFAVAAAAALGGLFTPGTWYRALEKPAWTPPNWIFGPVWTFLYLSMVIAGGLLWLARNDPDRPARFALTLLGIQLCLNALWSPLFFGLHWMGVAALEIILLAATLAVCCLVFWKVNRVASILFWPYLLWVSFAAVLNVTLFAINR